MTPHTSRHAYRVLLVGLLSMIPAAHAQSACGLQGFSSCTVRTETTGNGCCPIGWECHATECSYTGTSTLPPKPTTTACPGVPAHYLCPQSFGGNCCYNAYACDPDNVSQCILTQTQRVYESVVTTTTVVGDVTQTITTTSLRYPWPTVSNRMTPDSVAESQTDSETGTPAPETTAAPTTTTQATSTSSTAAAGHVEARIGGLIGGIVAGLLV